MSARLQSSDLSVKPPLIGEEASKIVNEAAESAMSETPSKEVTQLLAAWSNGDRSALERLLPLVEDELHNLAHRYMSQERANHTLQTAALVNEAYIKLIDQRVVHWQNRAHFFGIAAQMMRRILVDRARQRRRIKRGAGAQVLELKEGAAISPHDGVDIVAIDEALSDLAATDQRKARVVELRFFGGLSVAETADFLRVSEITVMREWKMAKAWLHRALSSE